MGVWGHQPPSFIFYHIFLGNPVTKDRIATIYTKPDFEEFFGFLYLYCNEFRYSIRCGSTYDASEIPAQKISAFLCTGNIATEGYLSGEGGTAESVMINIKRVPLKFGLFRYY
jgi:hypothetical protein